MGATTLLLSIASHATAGRGFDRQVYGVGEWRLAISRDSFSHDVMCDLHAREGSMRYVENAIGLQLGRGADVLQSWYSIDAGEPRRWRDQLPELARLRVAIDGRDMDRPTDGMIWLPVDQLENVRSVAVQPRPGSKPRSFSLEGFWRLYDYAVANGCTPESRFIR